LSLRAAAERGRFLEAAVLKKNVKRAPSVRQERASRKIRETLVTFAGTRERLARLPDEQRLPLTFVMIDGLSYGDAAMQLGVPVSVLMERLTMARASLSAMVAMSSLPLAAE
jgi:DNA-directed RNA polymerase specialized sigma24 family protein